MLKRVIITGLYCDSRWLGVVDIAFFLVENCSLVDALSLYYLY